MWKSYRSTNKRYVRDNRLIFPESSYRWICLAPRCWLIATWSWKRFQRLGCSPIKAIRELSSERCETVRFLSATELEDERLENSTRGSRASNRWCFSYRDNGIAELPSYEKRIAECIWSEKLLSQLPIRSTRIVVSSITGTRAVKHRTKWDEFRMIGQR